MSKKDRLKAQKEKQEKERKELEELEKKQAELSRSSESKSARKMREQAKKHEKKFRPFGEPVYFLILKILMLVPFAYSGFFYGGVLAAGVFGGAIDDKPPVWVGWCTVIGVLVIGAGIFLAFFKKYIASFVFNSAGTIVFLKAAQYMIDKIKGYLSQRAVEESLQNMAKQYMKYYYPITGVIIISFVLLICSIVINRCKKNKLRHEQETAPVKSIIE